MTKQILDFIIFFIAFNLITIYGHKKSNVETLLYITELSWWVKPKSLLPYLQVELACIALGAWSMYF